MHIFITYLHDVSDNNKQSISMYVPEEHVKEFKTLINRAMNTWDEASPEMKEFADLVIHGKILQDYRSQDSSKRNAETMTFFGRDSEIESEAKLREDNLKIAANIECPNCAIIDMQAFPPTYKELRCRNCGHEITIKS